MALLRGQIRAFLITFVAYACLHVTRKGLSNVKPQLTKLFGFDSTQLGLLDSLFLFGYALGLLVFGKLGDYASKRNRIIGCGLIMTAVLVAAMGFGEQLSLEFWPSSRVDTEHVSDVSNRNEDRLYLLVYLGGVWSVCGIFQGTGWPNNVAVMESWFPKEHRGKVYGLWSADINVGNIVGGVVAAGLLGAGINWAWCFFVPAMLALVWGIVVLFGLVPHPRADVFVDERLRAAAANDGHSLNAASVHANSPLLADGNDCADEANFGGLRAVNDEENPPPSFFQAWLVPGVALYAVSYAFLKGVNYALFFWLPDYLTLGLGISNSLSDLLSTLFDVGSIVGGTCFGLLTDPVLRKFKNVGRTFMIFPALLIGCGTLYLFRIAAPHGSVANSAVMFVCGVFQGGIANFVAAAVASDLATQKQVGAGSTGTITGIIDGTGAIGAACTQYMVGYIKHHFGWDAVFLALIIMQALCAVTLSGLFFKDVRKLQVSRF